MCTHYQVNFAFVNAAVGSEGKNDHITFEQAVLAVVAARHPQQNTGSAIKGDDPILYGVSLVEGTRYRFLYS